MNEELQKIVTEINHVSGEVNKNEQLSTTHSKLALQLAIRTGGLLAESKKLLRLSKSGIGWETWFAQNITGFTIRTAQNWMNLHRKKTKDASFFDDCDSTNQAYAKLEKEKNNPAALLIEQTKSVTGEVTDTDTETPPTAPTAPERDPNTTASGWEKKVKSKVNSLVNIFKKYNLEEYPETVCLLLPIVQIWQERPKVTVTLDGGRVITEPKTDTAEETVTTE